MLFFELLLNELNNLKIIKLNLKFKQIEIRIEILTLNYKFAKVN